LEICSIGTSGISAREFFGLLKENEVSCIVDTRLHASSQLAGFSRKDSLAYFADEILNITYIHELSLAPEAHMLKAYRNKQIDWQTYEIAYVELLKTRCVPDSVNLKAWGERPVLLCSENIADHCHRRIAADFIATYLNGAVSSIRHL
jgi:uncharacterized protein (DUF488 family)